MNHCGELMIGLSDFFEVDKKKKFGSDCHCCGEEDVKGKASRGGG